MTPETKKDTRETLFLRVKEKILSNIADLAKREGIKRNQYILRLLKKESDKVSK